MKAFVKVRGGLVVGVSMRDYKGDLAPCEFEFEYQGEIRPLVLPAEYGILGPTEFIPKDPVPKAPEKPVDSFTRPFSFSDEGWPICGNCSGSGSMCSPSGDNPRTCQICDGKGIYPAGKVKCQSCDGWGQSSVDGFSELCPDCKGSALMDEPKAFLPGHMKTVTVDFGMSPDEFTRQLVETGGKVGARVAEEREKRILKAFVDGGSQMNDSPESMNLKQSPDPVVNDLGETKGEALARMMGMDPAYLERHPIVLTPGGPDDISAKALA